MKNIIDRIKKFGIIETIIICIYIIIVLSIAINHECYEDETQSWLIARDLNLIEIVNQMKYEGHSFLWYFILVPFAKLGFPIETQIYITCAFAIGTVYLILKKAPFNKLIKILLTFSSGMIYWYSIIARPYCMIPFLLVCISILYKNKKQHPYIYAVLIGLLANTHLIMVPTATLLTIFFWGEELIIKRKIQSKEEKIRLSKSLIIALIGIVIYLIIMIQGAINCQIVDNFNQVDNIKEVKNVFYLIQGATKNTMYNLYGEKIVPLYYEIILYIILILCTIGSIYNIKQAIIFWSQLIFTILIHSLFWFVLPTRVFIVIYTLMFWLWNYKEDQQYKNKCKNNIWIQIALIVLILISNPSTYKMAYQDIIGNFSTGKMMAEYIEKNIPEDTCFICMSPELHQSVAAYLEEDKYKFYMPNSDKFVTYITWDENWNRPIDMIQAKEDILDLKDEFKNLYIINIIPSMANEYEEIYNTEGKLIDSMYVRREIFYIYKIQGEN